MFTDDIVQSREIVDPKVFFLFLDCKKIVSLVFFSLKVFIFSRMMEKCNFVQTRYVNSLSIAFQFLTVIHFCSINCKRNVHLIAFQHSNKYVKHSKKINAMHSCFCISVYGFFEFCILIFILLLRLSTILSLIRFSWREVSYILLFQHDTLYE